MPPARGAPWWQHPGAAAALAAALFARSVLSGYSFDDRAAVRDNADVADAARPWAALLADDFWGAPVASPLSHKSWRPLTVACWRLVRAAAAPAPAPGEPLRAAPFHALNVALHAAVTWQVHGVAAALAGLAAHPAPDAAATAAAALFAAHPVHCEAVCGLVGAAELLSALFALRGLRCYAQAAAAPSCLRAAAPLALALLLALAAAASKETGLTALGAYVAWEWLLRAGASPPTPPPRAAAAAARAVACAAAGAAYLAARRSVLGPAMLTQTWRVSDNHLPFLPTPASKALSVAHLHWRYAYLLLLPLHLCADWNYACVPPVTRLADPRNAGALALYAMLAALVYAAAPWRALLLRSPSPERRPQQLRLYCAAALGLAPLVPAMNVLFFIGAYLAERLLYSPSIGFCVALGAELTRAPPGGRAARLRLTALILIVLLYSARTVVRVPEWNDDSTIFAAAARTCPNGARARFNAGVQRRMAGDCAAAEVHFRAALAVLPDDNCGPHYELGVCAHRAGRVGEAAHHFESALGCIETAANAGEALRKVLSALHAAHPGEPAVLLAFARVAPRLDGVSGEADACAAAGAAAEALEARGDGAGAKAARKLCGAGAKAARKAAGVPIALSGAAECDAAAPAAVAQYAATADAAARATVASRFVQRHGAACRGHAAYTKAVNAMQTADPYHPLLHLEWARLLRGMLTRDADADTHIAVATQLFRIGAASAREEGRAAAAAEMDAQAAAAEAEQRSWAGVPAGPRSVKRLRDAQLKIEL